MKKFILFAMALAALCACRVKDAPQEVQQQPEPVVFTASYGNSRTTTDGNGKVLWSPGDEVAIWNTTDVNASLFTAHVSEASLISELWGTFDTEGYNFDADKDKDKDKDQESSAMSAYVAVYPYSLVGSQWGKPLNSSYSQSNPTWDCMVTLPKEQTARADSFDDNLFVSYAVSQTKELRFHHATGGFKFTVTSSNITRVEIETEYGYNNFLTDIGYLYFDAETYDFRLSKSGDNHAWLVAPDGQTLIPGKYYYIVTWPAILANGFKVKFVTADGGCKNLTVTSSLEIRAGHFLRIENFDASAEEHGMGSGDLEDISYDPIN